MCDQDESCHGNNVTHDTVVKEEAREWKVNTKHYNM